MDIDELLAQNVSDERLVEWETDDLLSAVLPVTIIFGLCSVLGLFGNAFTIYVFLLRYKHCNFRYFVLGLALTDLVSCLTTLPAEMFSYTHWYSYVYKFQGICKTKDLFNQATVLSEAAFLTCIAVDRYLKVCRPFRRQISQRFAVRLSLVIFILSFILAIPTPIFWGIHTGPFNVTNSTDYTVRIINVTVCEKDEHFKHTVFPMVNVIVNGSFVCIADGCVVVLYMLVVRRLRLIRRRKEKMITKPRDVIVEFNGTVARATTSNSDNFDQSNATSELPDDKDFPDNGTNHAVVSQATSDTSRQAQRITDLTSITRVRRRTLLGFYLTAIFIFTTVLYWSLLTVMATSILETLNDQEKAAFFFFLRLYFVNHFINPILYGLMDPQFSKEMSRLKNKYLCSSNN